MNYVEEFDKQVQYLIDKGYPQAAIEKAKELKILTKDIDGEIDLETGKLPFVIVVTEKLIDLDDAMTKIEKNNKPGISKLKPFTSKDFETRDFVQIPSSVYLLVDIDRGKESLNVRPEDALKEIQKQNRSPLTIAEGVAIVTHYPEYLMKNNCFSLLGSRKTGTQHVPAIWINAAKQANLGWCWDRNPHTWLGSASANERLG